MSSEHNPAPTAPPSYCYRQAYLKKKNGDITEKEYFYHLFQHVSRTGIEHKGDANVRSGLGGIDALGYQINCMIINMKQPVDDPTPFEDVFSACHRDTVVEMRAKLAKLPPSYQSEVRKPLALLALQSRNAPVLKWLIKEGIYPYGDAFEAEARRVQKGKRDIETWKVLHETRLDGHVPWKGPKQRGNHPLN